MNLSPIKHLKKPSKILGKAWRFLKRRIKPAYDELRRISNPPLDAPSVTASPDSIRLEASPLCQLRCPSCPTTQGIIGKSPVGKKFLEFKDFKKLIDKNPWIRTIELSNWGEIFLNPQLLSILSYAHEKKVALVAGNGANFNYVRPEVLEGLVKYQLRAMTLSIDGSTQSSYVQYRIRGDFHRVIENIRTLNAHKEKYASPYPRLSWQFVLFDHNKNEIDAARKLAKELGMEFVAKLSWDANLKVKLDEKSPDSLKYLISELEKSEAALLKSVCHQLWLEPQINSDGKILGCCVNYWQDFGEAFNAPDLLKVLNGVKLVYARKMLAGLAAPKKGIPCTDCHHYKTLQKKQDWVTQSEINLDFPPQSNGILGSCLTAQNEKKTITQPI